MKSGEAYLQSRSKRAFDVAISHAASPANTLAVAIARRTFSETDNPLLTQNRVGANGERMHIDKIRTLLDEDSSPINAMARYFRKIGLDELPQMELVRRGDMSIFGPRPLLEDEDAAQRAYLETTLDGQRLLAMEARYVRPYKRGLISTFGFEGHAGHLASVEARYASNILDGMRASMRYDFGVAKKGMISVLRGELSVHQVPAL